MISPGQYPFSGGAFMGGGGTGVTRDDIHTLTLERNGEAIGNWNPLDGDRSIEIGVTPNRFNVSSSGNVTISGLSGELIPVMDINVARAGIYIINFIGYVLPLSSTPYPEMIDFDYQLEGSDGDGIHLTHIYSAIDFSNDFRQGVSGCGVCEFTSSGSKGFAVVAKTSRPFQLNIERIEYVCM